MLNNKNDDCELYPLELNYCPNCHNCQLSVAVDQKKMFSNYLYTSSTSKTFREHFLSAAKQYINELKLKKKSFIQQSFLGWTINWISALFILDICNQPLFREKYYFLLSRKI